MSDLIRRSTLLEEFRKCYSGHMGMENSDAMMTFKGICNVIKKCPSAEPERKTGIWKNRSLNIVYPEWERYECSACGAYSYIHKFCPNCGAFMRGEQE